MQGKSGRKPTISLRLPAKLVREMDDLVARSGMRSRTDFIERAVEAYVEDLRNTKVVVLRSWTEAKARAAVMRFIRKRGSAYVSDVVEGLGMEPELAWRIVDALTEEGRIE